MKSSTRTLEELKGRIHVHRVLLSCLMVQSFEPKKIEAIMVQLLDVEPELAPEMYRNFASGLLMEAKDMEEMIKFQTASKERALDYRKWSAFNTGVRDDTDPQPKKEEENE